MNALVLWIAQGFYIGRIRVAPGTFGSFLGLGWLALLLWGGPWGFALGAFLSTAASVWVCGRAEKILGRADPGSVVLDEIVAIPVCFLSWAFGRAVQGNGWPLPSDLIASEQWMWTLGTLLAFRFFDIVKPWPVRQSQALPGGWGVTVDDLLAAVYVNLTVLACGWAGRFLEP